MAVSKVILNGETLMDVTVDTVTSEKLLTGYQATGRDGVKVQGAYIPQSVELTAGSADPSENAQHITPPSGYDGFEYFDVSAVSSNYVGSNIARHSAADLSASGSVVSVPSGYYTLDASTAIAAGSVQINSLMFYNNPTINFDNSTGVVTASVGGGIGVGASVTSGYVTSVVNGSVNVSGSSTLELTTASASTYTPSSITQTIPSGIYLTGVQTVEGDENFVAANIASGVTIFGVLGTHQGGTDTDDATLNNSNQMLNGVTAYAKGSKYTGNIPTRSSANVTVNGSAVSVQSGYYASAVSTNVAEGSVQVHNLSLNRTPTISFDSVTGVLTATQPNGSTGIGATVTTGYITQNDVFTGSVNVNGSASYELNTQAAVTITPTESSQTAVASGKYTTGAVTIAAIPSDYIGSAIASVEVDEGITTVSGSTATRGDATWSAGIIAAGNMGAATFANSSSGQTQYVDISNTTEAPVLVSGGYLYINKGYTDDLKISLAKLVPDGASADLASGVILSGYAAYDNDGNLVAGNIPTKSSSNVTASGSVVTVPSGYYATEVSKAIASAKFYEGMDMTNLDPSITVSNTGLITAEFSDTYTGDFIRTPGYASQAIMTFSAAGSSSYQLSTQAAATITPTESSQTAVASGKYTLGPVTVAAISSNYVGSNIPARSSSNLSASGSVVTAAAGYYANAASKAVAAGTATTPATTITANPGISVNSSTGVITATTASSKSITPTISAGYINTGTAGTVTVSGTTSSALSIQAAATINPTESEQTAVAAGKYTTGVVKVGAISSNYIGSNIATQSAQIITPGSADITIASGQYLTGVQTIKGDANLTAANIAAGVSIFGITGTHTGFSYTDEIDSHGGTIRHFVSGGGGENTLPWLGTGASFVKTNTWTVNLSDTSFDNWTASTSATQILAAPDDYDSTCDYNKYTETLFAIIHSTVNYSFVNGATLQNLPFKFDQIFIVSFIGVPSTITQYQEHAIGALTNYTMSAIARGYYYDGSGVIGVLNGNYGIYPYSNPSVTYTSSGSTVTAKIKRNAIYARCNDIYFAAARKSDIDVSKTKLTYKVDWYKIPRTGNFLVHAWDELLNIINS